MTGPARASHGRQVLAVGLAGLALALTAGSLVLVVMDASSPVVESLGFYGLATIVTGATFAVAGLLITDRRSRHRIGWICLVIGVSQAASVTSTYAGHAYLVAPVPLPGAGVAAWMSAWVWVPGYWLMISLPCLFPDGRPSGGLARMLIALAAIGIGLTTVPLAVASLPYAGPQLVNGGPPPSDPVVAAASTLNTIGIVGSFVIALGGIAVIVRRFRRSDGIERQQLKWFVTGTIVFVALLWLVPTFEIGGILQPALAVVAGIAVPGAIGVAILRYRLFDIDRLISRGLSWGLLSVVLVAVYGAVVIVLGDLAAGATGSATIVVAVATLAAAALFAPLRTRIQGAVDRRFDRARYDGERTAAAFAERIRSEVALEALADDLTTTTSEAIHPLGLSVWLRSADR